MKKAKSWLALPLAVCMFAVMIFSVAEAAETSDENPAEGRQEITIINTNHITWPVIGEMPSYELEVPAGAHYFINMVLARLDRLWIGAMDPKNGACGSVFNVVQEERLNHRMEVETGILEAECGQILSDFFRNMRAVKARKRKLFRQRMTSPDNTDGGNN